MVRLFNVCLYFNNYCPILLFASDIKLEDIDDSLWRSGVAMNHGLDRNDHNIIILDISKHKKDSKKAIMVQKWIAFCFEVQVCLPDC